MTVPPPADPDRPQHDPMAEEMDLMTLQEARARFYDRITELRVEEAELVRAGSDPGGLAAVRRLIADLQAASERIGNGARP